MPKQVTDEYKELFHYTSGAGLEGIVASQCLRATHSSFLNDATEIKLFFDTRLYPLIETEVQAALAELLKIPGNDKILTSLGGSEVAVREEAKTLTQNIRTSTLAFNHPYILSLSGTKDKRVEQHGLLSQWRGYGREGGYALVFDTVRLQEMLEVEGSAFQYQNLQRGNVQYYSGDDDDPPPAEDIQEAEETLKRGIAKFLLYRKPEHFETIYDAVTTLSCLYKHWGFHEEREVRVVAIPVHASVAAISASIPDAKPLKPVKSFIRDGCPVPYIELFKGGRADSSEHKLPIVRVVVGPHKDKELRREATKLLLQAHGTDADVSFSEIPYIGK